MLAKDYFFIILLQLLRINTELAPRPANLANVSNFGKEINNFCFHNNQHLDISHFGLKHCHLPRYKHLQLYRIPHSLVFKIVLERCVFFTYEQSHRISM